MYHHGAFDIQLYQIITPYKFMGQYIDKYITLLYFVYSQLLLLIGPPTQPAIKVLEKGD